MDLTDFFDPYNIEHVKAYKCVMETGVWPVEFNKEMEEKGIKRGYTWQVGIAMKIADAWVKEKTEG